MNEDRSKTESCTRTKYTYDQWANMSAIGVLSSAYNGCTQDSLSVTPTANNQLSATGYSYDASGNMLTDGSNTYVFNAESEITSGGGITYKYDGDGNRIEKSNGKIFWYGAGTEIIDESDFSGNITSEYVFFGGKRIARRVPSSGNIYYYEEDMLGSSRTVTQAGQTSPCYDSDFRPFGSELSILNTCLQDYKFEGKERDTETGNDDFGARYYRSNLGRWLSADWSSVPAPVPYANLANPQTLNLYAMVSDNPETFADLDGHIEWAPFRLVESVIASGGVADILDMMESMAGPSGYATGLTYEGTLNSEAAQQQGQSTAPTTPTAQSSSTTTESAQNQSTQQQTSSSQQCEAQMRSRPGDITAAWGHGASHAWWYIVDGTGQDHTLSFTMNMTLKGPYLNAYAADGSQSSSNANDNLKHGSVVFDVKGPSVCAGVAKMIQATKDFPHNSVRYGPLKGEATSNSGARYLGAVGGFKPPMPSQPGLRAVGWDLRIPGVE